MTIESPVSSKVLAKVTWKMVFFSLLNYKSNILLSKLRYSLGATQLIKIK